MYYFVDNFDNVNNLESILLKDFLLMHVLKRYRVVIGYWIDEKLAPQRQFRYYSY